MYVRLYIATCVGGSRRVVGLCESDGYFVVTVSLPLPLWTKGG